MDSIQRMTQVLTQKLGFYVPVQEIGYETLWLYKDEIDERLVAAHLLEQLDETIIFSLITYTGCTNNYRPSNGNSNITWPRGGSGVFKLGVYGEETHKEQALVLPIKIQLGSNTNQNTLIQIPNMTVKELYRRHLIFGVNLKL